MHNTNSRLKNLKENNFLTSHYFLLLWRNSQSLLYVFALGSIHLKSYYQYELILLLYILFLSNYLMEFKIMVGFFKRIYFVAFQNLFSTNNMFWETLITYQTKIRTKIILSILTNIIKFVVLFTFYTFYFLNSFQ